MADTTHGQSINIKDAIIENIIKMIFSGILNRGDFLPSIRNMCARYHVSRNTVVVAYKDLESLGLIEGKERSCYQVLSAPRSASTNLLNEIRRPSARPLEKKQANLTHIATKLMMNNQASLSRHFIKRWSSDLYSVKKVLAEENGSEQLNQELQKNLHRYLKITRGIDLALDKMLLLPGQQEALLMIAHFGKLLKSRPTIILGDPVSPKVFDLFACLGYEILSVPSDRNGLDVSAFPDRCVDFVYLSPSCHFPSGAKMSEHNRKLLMEWSSQNDNAFIIEDDACFMLGFGQDMIPPLCASYPARNVIYLYNLFELTGNSASLSLLMAPESIRDKFRELKNLTISENQILNRTMLASFLGSNYLMKYLASTLQQRQEKFNLALEGLKKVTPDPDVWGLIHSGFFTFSAAEESLPATLREETFLPLSLFYRSSAAQPDSSRYIYPLGTLTTEEIENINHQLLLHNPALQD